MEEGRAGGGGEVGGDTKIASSDLSFINFSTPAATHWNRDSGRGKEPKMKSCQMKPLVPVPELRAR